MSELPILSEGPEYFETLAHNADQQHLIPYAPIFSELSLADADAQKLMTSKTKYFPPIIPDYKDIIEDINNPSLEAVVNTLIVARDIIRDECLGYKGYIYRYSPDDGQYDRNSQFVQDIYQLLGVAGDMYRLPEKDNDREKDVEKLVWIAESNVGARVVELLYKETEKILRQSKVVEIGYISIRKTLQA